MTKTFVFRSANFRNVTWTNILTLVTRQNNPAAKAGYEESKYQSEEPEHRHG